MEKAGNVPMKRLPWYSAILYIFGALIGIFAAWTAIDTVREILEFLGRGIPMFDFITFFANQSGKWIVYTLVLLALGRILHIMSANSEDLYLDDDAAYEEDDEDDQDTPTQTTPEADK
jgi:hypothetical protein